MWASPDVSRDAAQETVRPNNDLTLKILSLRKETGALFAIPQSASANHAGIVLFGLW